MEDMPPQQDWDGAAAYAAPIAVVCEADRPLPLLPGEAELLDQFLRREILSIFDRRRG